MSYNIQYFYRQNLLSTVSPEHITASITGIKEFLSSTLPKPIVRPSDIHLTEDNRYTI